MAEEPVVPIDTPLNAEDSKLLKDLDSGQVSVQVSDTSNISKPKIQKVPEFMLRQEDLKKYYEPSEIAIGPLHANSDKLKKEELKVKFTRKFIEKSGKTAEIILKEIKKNIGQIKQSFDEILINDISDDRLARMLLLDGCSILEFISSYVDGDLTHFNINNGQAALIEQDLFLLENQIPFRVLTLLMKLSGRENGMMDDIYMFILMNLMVPTRDYFLYIRYIRNKDRFLSEFEEDKEPVHLLDFLRSEILLDDTSPGLSRQNTDDNAPNPVKFSIPLPFRNVRNLIKAGPCFRNVRNLIKAGPCFRNVRSLIKAGPCFRNVRSLITAGPCFGNVRNLIKGGPYFRNVQDLKEAGVKFMPSYSHSLRSVSFSSLFFIAGQLKLPRLLVDGSTAPKLLNLAAYEMCFANYMANNEVTSYLNFLDSLIDSEEDVRDLRRAHIIQNHLSSDAEAAQLFNSMGKSLVLHDAYFDVTRKIHDHYQRKPSFWIAQVYKDHFRSPWAILALLAATTILLLTAVQTYYAIHPKK